MKDSNKSLKDLLKKEDMCELKAGGIIVEVSYSKNGKSFHECMLNIIKHKLKEADIFI